MVINLDHNELVSLQNYAGTKNKIKCSFSTIYVIKEKLKKDRIRGRPG